MASRNNKVGKRQKKEQSNSRRTSRINNNKNTNNGVSCSISEKDSRSTSSSHRKFVLHVITVMIFWPFIQRCILNYRNRYRKPVISSSSKFYGNQKQKDEPIKESPEISEVIRNTHQGSTHFENEEDRVSNFLEWFENMGGYISPRVTLQKFPDFGGYGLLALPIDSIKEDNVEGRILNKNPAVEPLDELFRIPPSIITSANSVFSLYHNNHDTELQESRKVSQFKSRLNSVFQRHFSSSNLVQQDVIIALHLMVECSLGAKSKLEPYLNLLPQNIIPRLDTFSEEELSMLDDPSLTHLAKESKRSLQHAWEDNNGGLKKMVIEMAMASQTQMDDELRLDTQSSQDYCLSYDSFHKYVSFVSSRAMVLQGVKFLAPLADMTNYAPRNDGRFSQQSKSFTLYHNRDDTSGFISVRADRAVKAGEQIFEDYGDVDNSLFLEAHGFVPDNNPFHCAMIPKEHQPLPKDLSSDIIEVLTKLKLMYISNEGKTNTPDVCVRKDGTLSTKWGEEYLKVAYLSNHFPQKRQLCVDAIKRGDINFAQFQCMRYDGHQVALKNSLKESARKAICAAKSTLEEDLQMAGSLVIQSKNFQREIQSDYTKKLLAMKFRISDKDILSHIGEVDKNFSCKNFKHGYIDKSKGKENNENEEQNHIVQETKNRDEKNCSNLDFGENAVDEKMIEESLLENFNEFILKLNISLQKIKPHNIGDGMRLGAIATENIDVGETYFGINDSSIISVDNAKVMGEDEKSISINRILDQHRYHSGGLHTLLFFLMHETFIAKEKSFWYPYISLLPSVEDMKKSVSLFLEREKLDFLGASDILSNILKYREKVNEEFTRFSSDIHIVDAFGIDIILDIEKFKWAYTIIDTRSIWWGGKRHLVPLLDLVNCNEVYDDNGSPNSVHSTFLDTDNFAITKASHAVSKGQQIFENYGQPNHIYFMYHGFILENNTHDCAFIEETILRSDPGGTSTNTRNRLSKNGFNPNSFTASFCMNNKDSLDRLADFLRIKMGINGTDNKGLQDDILDVLESTILTRLQRHSDSNKGEIHHLEEGIEREMFNLLKSEEEIFLRLINDINTLKSTY